MYNNYTETLVYKGHPITQWLSKYLNFDPNVYVTPTLEETLIRCGIKGKNQGPLFMVWKEYLEDGEVIHATVLFNSRDWCGV